MFFILLFVYLLAPHKVFGMLRLECGMSTIYTVSQKKGATLTMAITLAILDRFDSFTAANSSKFPTKLILGYPHHLKYVAALPWKT